MPESRPIGDELARRWREGGDRDQIFYQLHAAYLPAIFNFFTRRGVARDECRDLAQDTMLKVFTGLDRFRHECSFDTWIFQIATNVYRNAVRHRAAAKRDAAELALEGLREERLAAAARPAAWHAAPETPLDDLLSGERRRQIRGHIAALPRQQRRCVRLRVDHGLSYDAIAELLGISVGAVKAHLFQARQQLKVRLGERLPDREPE
jgi:RNA polymerase sigma-70 factor (ECF subfamily)